MDTRRHWESVYESRPADGVSWFRPHLDRSLDLIASVKLPRDAPIVDVGAGASTLVDDLFDRGFSNVTVVDVSDAALRTARTRLGDRGAKWLRADVTNPAELPPRAFRFWHDRALFHFLLEPEARARYVAALRRSVQPGGYVLIAAFGPNGPKTCSGLEIRRYDAKALHEELGPEFDRISDSTELHTTPQGAPQEFVYALFRRSESEGRDGDSGS
jgi:SAM-dependent methyltransferase